MSEHFGQLTDKLHINSSNYNLYWLWRGRVDEPRRMVIPTTMTNCSSQRHLA